MDCFYVFLYNVIWPQQLSGVKYLFLLQAWREIDISRLLCTSED